jgi:hypothetical protein
LAIPNIPQWLTPSTTPPPFRPPQPHMVDKLSELIAEVRILNGRQQAGGMTAVRQIA